jgi:acetylornithine deacetylase/succinyl-diaminopimelate desuccinylase-like protein
VVQNLRNQRRVLDAGDDPKFSTGFTDSHFTRDLGIASYGFDPKVTAELEIARIHGNDERVSVAAFRRGVRDMRAIVSEVVYDP